jgi:hypothetical protein
MKIILEWHEGRETRRSEGELSANKSWPEIVECIRQEYKKAVKYSDEPIPEGLLRDGEVL